MKTQLSQNGWLSGGWASPTNMANVSLRESLMRGKVRKRLLIAAGGLREAREQTCWRERLWSGAVDTFEEAEMLFFLHRILFELMSTFTCK